MKRCLTGVKMCKVELSRKKFVFFTKLCYQLQHSPAFSNAICEKCDKELMNFSIFQQDVRAKQNFLNDHVNGTTLKNEFIKVETCEDVFVVELEEAVGAKVEDDSYFQGKRVVGRWNK